MNLFIGNLSPEITEQHLREAFSEFGPIKSLKIIIDPQTGMPKGFGFVEMEERRDAYEAITNLDMTYLHGSVISVKQAKDNRQQSNDRQDRSRLGSGKFHPNRQPGSYGDQRGNYNSDRPGYKRPNFNSDNFNNNNDNSLDY